MSFDWNKYLGYAINQQIVVSLVIVGLLCLLAIWLSKKIDKLKPEDKPPMIISLFEVLASIINNFVKSTIGKKRWKSYAPYIFALAIYLTCANLSGLFGVTPPTSCWNITIGLALITAVLIHYTGIKSNGGWGYIKSTYLSPLPFLLPLNLIGEITFPLSLSLRLLGNIMSGSVISMMIYTFASNNLPWGGAVVIIMPVYHAIFDIVFGGIQVVVFVLLSTIFISQKVNEKELTDEVEIENKHIDNNQIEMKENLGGI